MINIKIYIFNFKMRSCEYVLTVTTQTRSRGSRLTLATSSSRSKHAVMRTWNWESTLLIKRIVIIKYISNAYTYTCVIYLLNSLQLLTLRYIYFKFQDAFMRVRTDGDYTNKITWLQTDLGYFKFKVKACSDAHVTLGMHPMNETTLHYEVAFGIFQRFLSINVWFLVNPGNFIWFCFAKWIDL